jgi:hypothetical protein
MARYTREPEYSSDSYRRSSRRRRKHRSYRRDDESLASRHERAATPEIDELRQARTQYYAVPPEERRRSYRTVTRVARAEPEPSHRSETRHRRRRRSEERVGTRARRQEDYDEDDDEEEDEDDEGSAVYVYHRSRKERDPGYSYRRTRSPRRTSRLMPERVTVVRQRAAGKPRRERTISRRVDDDSDDREPLERVTSTRRAPVVRSISVREHDRPKVARQAIRRSATTARPRPHSTVEPARRVARAPSLSGKTAISDHRKSNPRASIFSIFVGPPPSQPKIERM